MSSNSYKVYHRPDPWTAKRKRTDKIIVHVRSAFTSALDVDTDFRKKGFLCCGYHYVVNGSGVSVMRHPETIGAGHPDHDQTTVYVAVLGYDGKSDLPKQLEGPLVSLLNDLTSTYPDAEIISAPLLMNVEGAEPFNNFIEERNAKRRK